MFTHPTPFVSETGRFDCTVEPVRSPAVPPVVPDANHPSPRLRVTLNGTPAGCPLERF
jgi:hypothetical protein